MELIDSPQNPEIKYFNPDKVAYSRCSVCDKIIQSVRIDIPTDELKKHYFIIRVPYCEKCEEIPSLKNPKIRKYIKEKRPEIDEKLMFL